MRLNNYLNESVDMSDIQIVDYIKDNCQPWLKEVGIPLYRGIGSDDTVIIKTPRTDRRPLSYNRSKHDLSDKVFKSIFGWKGRSEAILSTLSKSRSHYFGQSSYMIFPVGNFKYIYSEKVLDFVLIGIGDEGDIVIPKHYDSEASDTLNIELDKGNKEVIDMYTDFLTHNYTDKGLYKYKDKSIEVMLKCEKYIGIKMEYFDRNQYLQRHIMELFK